MRAAAQQFATQGFGGTMRDLAAVCGVTAGLFDRPFPSKGALIDEMFADLRSRWGEVQAVAPEGRRGLPMTCAGMS